MQPNFHVFWTGGIVAFVLGKHELTQDMSNLMFVENVNAGFCDVGLSPEESVRPAGDKQIFVCGLSCPTLHTYPVWLL